MFKQHRTNGNNWFNNLTKKGNGRSSKLLYLYTHIAGKEVTEQHYIGKHQVTLSQIQGSLNPLRCKDFDSNFRLLNKHGQGRLNDVAQAWKRKSLPPVSLIQVGDIYFVQDGHHRVSIAISNQQELISAEVTVMVFENNQTSLHLAHA